MPEDNACTRCGACCAAFRVDFDRAELQSVGGCVPDSLSDDPTGTACRRCRCKGLTRRWTTTPGPGGQQRQAADSV